MSVQVHTSGQVTINGDAVLNVGSGDGGSPSTPVDLSAYVKKTELNAAVESLQNQMNSLGSSHPIFEPEVINGVIENQVFIYPEKKPFPDNQYGIPANYGFLFSLPYQVGQKITLALEALPEFDEIENNQISYSLSMDFSASTLNTLRLVDDIPRASHCPFHLNHMNQKEMSGDTYQMSFMFSFYADRLPFFKADVELEVEMLAPDYIKISLVGTPLSNLEKTRISIYQKVPFGSSNLIFRMQLDGMGLPEDFICRIPYQITEI